jgi:hypothetical protein
MLKVRISNTYPEWPLLRQTPGGKGVWGNCRFFVNEDADECDYWVVHEGLLKAERAVCPPENTILITGEPPAVKTYDPGFLKQFATIIACDRNTDHPNVVLSQQSLPWHVGRFVHGDETLSFSKDYDELSRITSFEKDKLISVITSDKTFTAGHAQRLEFTRRLGGRLGSRIDVFGRGVRDIEDKWDGISRYKYHVVIENCCYPDYWTEKLADAYLGGAYPFYYGCPNLADYFSAGAFTPINISNVDAAVSVIEDAIAQHRYETSVSQIKSARNSVLNRYNLFPMICDHISSRGHGGKKQTVAVQPESAFRYSVKPESARRFKRLRPVFSFSRSPESFA